jgi:diguanylate cyclase (GGDEF)-like protein
MPTNPPSVFEQASREVLRFLHDRLGFKLWMVTRKEGSDWIFLQAEDHGYDVQEGAVFQWTDSFCSRMVAGKGPRIAPRSASVPAYAEAPIGRQVGIGAYAGVPLTFRDGSLFGTLCAIDPDPQPAEIADALPLVELLAGLLSKLLNIELGAMEATRRAEGSAVEAETDAMTGLYNRRGWNRLLGAEEVRCRRYGHPACVVAVDLDQLKLVNEARGHAAGDEWICLAAHAIRTAVRESDVVARVGGDEFAVMCPERSIAVAPEILKRIRMKLASVHVAASVGLAMSVHPKGLQNTWREAHVAMYREKGASRTQNPFAPLLAAKGAAEAALVPADADLAFGR